MDYSQFISKKEDRRVRKTKKNLRESLFKLLETKSINQITVTELTELADVNRSTFYLYYTDIFDMMEKIQNEIYTVFVDTVVAGYPDSTNPDEIFDYCAKFLDFCKENYTVCKFITRNDCNNQLAEKIKESVRSYIPDSKKHFDKNDPRYYLTTFALSAILSVILEWMNDGMKIPSKDMAKFLGFTYVLGANAQKEGELHKLYTNS